MESGNIRMYCNVAVPIPADQLYTYAIPEKFRDLVYRGQRVYVHLKSQAEPIVGYVMSVAETCDYPPESVKPIYDIVDSLPISEDLLALAGAISEKYLCSPGSALDLVIPSSLTYSTSDIEEFFDFNRKFDVFKIIADASHSRTERLIIQYLYNSGAASLKELETNLMSDRTTVKNNIAKLKLSRAVVSSFSRTGFIYGSGKKDRTAEISGGGMEFTDEQKNAIRLISEKIDKNECSETLIFGVTGSGKTEVYIEILKKVTAAGKSAIVLVPEIALTEHLKHRFLKAFPDSLAVWHSLVTKAEKSKIYSGIAAGSINILLGARSAIFAPFDNPGCIIIDEEHDSSYKQDNGIRYDAREVSRMRMARAGGALILGTATPSLETYYKLGNSNAGGGVVRLEKRVENRPLPVCHIVDMGKEFSVNKNKSIFSALLSEKIQERIDKKQQVLLFLNRRGHSTFVLCRSCGHVIKCDDCAVSMTYHSEPPKLLCHYCNKVKEVPMLCPKCQSHYIRFFGVGTEKVEDEFRRRFPGVNVARLDSDVLVNKTITAKIFDDFLKKKIDVLIGTQMISKGLDFHNITLVGIISADTALNMPDMFASERTFQVLCQVIGRTGRGQDEGECVIQTYNPDNYAITSAASSDFSTFYKSEIEIRQALLYPPVTRMIKIGLSSEQESAVIETARKINIELAPFIRKNESSIKAIGPAPALISRVQNIYRYNMFLFALDEEIVRDELLKILKKYSFTNKKQCVKIFVDISPNNTY